MVCDDVRKIHKYIEKNEIDVTDFELVKVACTNCEDKDDCVTK